MTKRSTAIDKIEALINGLETLVLENEVAEKITDSEEKRLSRSMQLILAASAARAKLDAAPAPRARRKSDLRKSAAIKLSELRSLLAPHVAMQPRLTAAFEGDDQASEKNLNSLIDDVERIMSSKRKA